MLALLFGFGGVLLLLMMLLEGPPGREDGNLAIGAAAAFAVALFIFVGSDRLPLWFLRASPAIGTLLGTVAVYWGGVEAAGSAMYLIWVVIAAAMFLDTGLIIAHGAIAVGAYAFVLSHLEQSDYLDPLRLTMLAATVLVIAVVTGSVASQLRQVLRKLEAAATTDPLTGLLNRRAFDDAFEIELARAKRGHFGLGVVVLDLDGFKRFNDEHGHQAGDLALQRLSRALIRHTRAIDHVGRIGGEEFAVLAPESGTAGSLAMAERLRRAVEIEFSGHGGLTASCGSAAYPENGAERLVLVGAADRAMYEAKALGKNRAIASTDSPASPSGAVS
jgi:diguanylate cyclase (GGDEF)-like protein